MVVIQPSLVRNGKIYWVAENGSHIRADFSKIWAPHTIMLFTRSINFHVTEVQVINTWDVNVDVTSAQFLVAIHVYVLASWWNTRVFLTKLEVRSSQKFSTSYSVWCYIWHHNNEIFQTMSCKWMIPVLNVTYTLTVWMDEIWVNAAPQISLLWINNEIRVLF